MTFYTDSEKSESFANHRYIKRELVDTYLSLGQQVLWGWGDGAYGALGVGDIIDRSSPVQTVRSDISGWRKIASNAHSCLATTGSNWLYVWGQNDLGQLGLSTLTNKSSPILMSTNSWKDISIGANHAAAVRSDGTLWVWGVNTYGQLGKGNTTSYSSPVQVGALTSWEFVTCGTDFTIAYRNDGNLYSMGRNQYGQLGLGDINNRSSPVLVSGSGTYIFKLVSGAHHTLLINSAGQLVAFGYNGQGQLGKGNTTSYSSPVQIGSLTSWTNISALGASSFGLRNGALYSWGYNGVGELGLGNTTNRNSPVQVGTDTNWDSVATGSTAYDDIGVLDTVVAVKAVKTDGTLWAWGDNSQGGLGIGDKTNKSSPVQVGTDTDWYKVSLTHALKIR